MVPKRVIVACALAVAVGTHAATRTYPGPAPCNGTLQACLDGASSGDRIEIATTAPIDESVALRKSLTLTGAAGVTPLIGGGTTERGMRLQPQGGAASVLVEGLTVSNGIINLVLAPGAEGSRLEVANCAVSTTTNNAVRIGAAVAGEFVVRDSRLASAAYDVVDMLTMQPSGAVNVSILRNRVTALAPNGSGVNVDLRGAGTAAVDVKSNVIHDVTLNGIAIVALENVAATVNVVNNTIVRANRGMYADALGAVPATVNLFNNVVVDTVGAGITLNGMLPALVVSAGFNDVFGNGAPNDPMGYGLGPLFTVDPLFVNAAAADFHLQAGSVLIDVGAPAPPGGLPELDLDGNVRVAGAAVDLGAYEFGSAPPSTTTSTTTSTTLPGCASGATFVSVRCRLAGLGADVSALVPAGKLATRLAALAGLAEERVARAESLAGEGRTRPKRKALGQAVRALGAFERKLGSRKAAALDAAARDALRATADLLQVDLVVLRAA